MTDVRCHTSSGYWPAVTTLHRAACTSQHPVRQETDRPEGADEIRSDDQDGDGNAVHDAGAEASALVDEAVSKCQIGNHEVSMLACGLVSCGV